MIDIIIIIDLEGNTIKIFPSVYLVCENNLEYGGYQAQYLSHSVLQSVERIVTDRIKVVSS